MSKPPATVDVTIRRLAKDISDAQSWANAMILTGHDVFAIVPIAAGYSVFGRRDVGVECAKVDGMKMYVDDQGKGKK